MAMQMPVTIWSRMIAISLGVTDPRISPTPQSTFPSCSTSWTTRTMEPTSQALATRFTSEPMNPIRPPLPRRPTIIDAGIRRIRATIQTVPKHCL